MSRTIEVKLPEGMTLSTGCVGIDTTGLYVLSGSPEKLVATQQAIAEALGSPSLQGQMDALRGDLERHKKEYNRHLLHDASDHVRYDKLTEQVMLRQGTQSSPEHQKQPVDPDLTTTRPVGQSCENCTYRHSHESDDAPCTRFPPVFAGRDPLGIASFEYPHVRKGHWCGEWKARQQTASTPDRQKEQQLADVLAQGEIVVRISREQAEIISRTDWIRDELMEPVNAQCRAALATYRNATQGSKVEVKAEEK